MAATVIVALTGVAGAARGQCEVDKVLAFDAESGDQYGGAVAVSGDLAVVGASRHDFYGGSSGAAYVLQHRIVEGEEEPRWTEQVRLVADDGAAGDLFGAAVAIDAGAPGGPVVVVGAYGDDHAGGGGAGSAYVFRGEPDGDGWTWHFEQKLIATEAEPGAEFGLAVAVFDTVIAIGAPRADAGDTNTGAVHVYRDVGSGWVEDATAIVASDRAALDQFGNAVSIDGDVILVGAELHDALGTSAGAAYVYRAAGPDWIEEIKLLADDAAIGDKFGHAVAISGDIAVVGAYLDDDAAANTGSVYVFRWDGAWLEPVKLRAPDAAMDDQFGSAVCVIDGPFDADLVAVGAPYADHGGATAGAAYAFHYDGIDWVATDPLVATDAVGDEELGSAIAVSSDFLLIGAPKDDDEVIGVNGGAVYVFAAEVEPGEDCNDNGRSDFCDITLGDSEDCNENDIPDECDLEDHPEWDANDNGVLDECEDCNDNGIPDGQDIEEGTSADCNGNGIPDECDVDPEDPDGDGEVSPDCNENGIPDECDIAEGTEEDCNGNFIPDSCDIAEGRRQRHPRRTGHRGGHQRRLQRERNPRRVRRRSRGPGRRRGGQRRLRRERRPRRVRGLQRQRRRRRVRHRRGDEPGPQRRRHSRRVPGLRRRRDPRLHRDRARPVARLQRQRGARRVRDPGRVGRTLHGGLHRRLRRQRRAGHVRRRSLRSGRRRRGERRLRRQRRPGRVRPRLQRQRRAGCVRHRGGDEPGSQRQRHPRRVRGLQRQRHPRRPGHRRGDERRL
jgi:hypothetical protein